MKDEKQRDFHPSSFRLHPFFLTLRRVWRKNPAFYHPFGGVPAMKRLLLLAALALAASACTTTTNTNTGAGNANANANANANTAAATPTPAAGPTQADLEAKERQIWDAIKEE